jgi:hypothetical protein
MAKRQEDRQKDKKADIKIERHKQTNEPEEGAVDGDVNIKEKRR